LANINVRIDDKMELALKKEANALGVSLSDLVREKLTGETKAKPLNQVTIESRIEQLEKQQRSMSVNIYFQSRFLYHFAILAANDEAAANAWEAAKKELKERG
jgi:antitoxin component of RelBE/YafQ-DinJ toxin-antitoxin module